MRMHTNHIIPLRRNNKGFSLIELLVSIVVLVIIMVPLMSNFIQAMRSNQKAEKLQLQSNLAASIMEGLKSYQINDAVETDIIEEFNGIRDNFDIISNPVEDVMRLELNHEGKFVRTTSEDEQATYYFAIHGILAGGTAYDAFIELDAEAYKENDGTMNLYPMPEVINLDEKANGLLFSNGTQNGELETEAMDDRALSTYVLWGTAYAQMKFRQSPEYLSYLDRHDKWLDEREQNEMDGSPLGPEPVEPTMEDYASTYDIYYNPNKVEDYITKTMSVSVSDKTVNYRVDYECIWPAGSNIEKTISNQISSVEYSIPIENIYLFYSPSRFQQDHSADSIVIKNDTPSNKINFFAAKQNGAIISNVVKLQRLNTEDQVSVYTDLTPIISYIGEVTEEGTGSINQAVVKSEEKNRIYDVTIKICEYKDVEPAHRYQKVFYTLEATKED